jgi:hypothetical protein
LDKPLHVIYKVSKLAYRIWVILVANKKFKKEEKKGQPHAPAAFTPQKHYFFNVSGTHFC